MSKKEYKQKKSKIITKAVHLSKDESSRESIERINHNTMNVKKLNKKPRIS